jgi:CHASE2 domain-containing sensor protein
MHHEANNVEVEDNNKDSGNHADNALFAFMAGQGSSSGDIRQVLATKRTPDKSKIRQANESKLTPSTVQVGDTTYYLIKGESITFQGHQYSSHMTKVNYRISQYDAKTMEYALIDRGANGGICGDDTSVDLIMFPVLQGIRSVTYILLQHRH